MRSIQLFQVTENRQIARDTYLLELEGDTAGLSHPSQFVNVDVPGFYLRRPLSVCAWRPGHVTLMYKILGQGTDALSHVVPGETLDVLSGLGNGFSIPEDVSNPLVVGGGIGVAPLLALTEALVKAGPKPGVIFGFGSEDEVAAILAYCTAHRIAVVPTYSNVRPVSGPESTSTRSPGVTREPRTVAAPGSCCGRTAL